jgi:hypothetical protein
MAAPLRAKAAMSGPDTGIGAFPRDRPDCSQIAIFKSGGRLAQRVRPLDVSVTAAVEKA